MQCVDAGAIIRTFYTAVDREHGRAVAGLVHPAFVAHLAGRPPLDHAAFAAALDALYAAFPDLRHHVQDMVVAGDRVAARLLERGTHRGAFAGFEPTGAVIEMAAMAIHRVEEGKLVELWLVADALGRLRQLESAASRAT